MKTYLVGYDLNSPGQDYEELLTAIKAAGAWWQVHGPGLMRKTQNGLRIIFEPTNSRESL